ncbi:hypothetical protein [Roseicyclus elongatus]|uniref:hypothetical protein n=1 Tax=Roseicyclus elongatus TaxID=159346 RepID=UPI001FE1C31F|nr:hypothetical protein [Roseibacterium elongatum]
MRCGLVVPQVGILDARVEFLQPVLGGLDIHALTQQVQRFADLLDMALGFGAHLCLPFSNGVAEIEDRAPTLKRARADPAR